MMNGFSFRIRPWNRHIRKPVCLVIYLTIFLSSSSSAVPLELDLRPSSDDLSSGPTVVLLPALRDGKPVDLRTFRLLHQELAKYFGARGVEANITLEAIQLNREAIRSLTAENWTLLANAVQAKQLIIILPSSSKNQPIEIWENASGGAKINIDFPLRGKRISFPEVQKLARKIIDDGHLVFAPPTPPPPPSSEPVRQEGIADVDQEQAREEEKQTTSSRAQNYYFPEKVIATLGGGAMFRTLSADTHQYRIPKAKGAMPGATLQLTLYPLRWIASLKDSWASTMSLEGRYRRTLARASLVVGDGEKESQVEDDEILARIGWHYAWCPKRPQLGLRWGLVSERTTFRNDEPTLNTKYQALEAHITVGYDLLPRFLHAEASGGPRFVLSSHGSDAPVQSFSGEAWLSSQPFSFLFARAGTRITSTRMANSDHVVLRDLHAYVGMEVGIVQ